MPRTLFKLIRTQLLSYFFSTGLVHWFFLFTSPHTPFDILCLTLDFKQKFNTCQATQTQKKSKPLSWRSINHCHQGLSNSLKSYNFWCWAITFAGQILVLKYIITTLLPTLSTRADIHLPRKSHVCMDKQGSLCSAFRQWTPSSNRACHPHMSHWIIFIYNMHIKKHQPKSMVLI